VRAHGFSVRAVSGRGTAPRLQFPATHLRVANRNGIVVHVHALHVGLTSSNPCVRHEIARLMEINRLGMHGGEPRSKNPLRRSPRFAMMSTITKLSRSRRASSLRPPDTPPASMPVPAGAVQEAASSSRSHSVGESTRRLLVGANRQLEGCALQVIHQNFEIVRLNVGVFRRTSKSSPICTMN